MAIKCLWDLLPVEIQSLIIKFTLIDEIKDNIIWSYVDNTLMYLPSVRTTLLIWGNLGKIVFYRDNMNYGSKYNSLMYKNIYTNSLEHELFSKDPFVIINSVYSSNEVFAKSQILTFFKTWDRRYKVQVLKDNGMCGKTRNSLTKKTLDELNTIYMKM
tara:strand:- start:1726 stop:2199 length:474 start_codon:yes stop_codon:yes gene_type:complete